MRTPFTLFRFLIVFFLITASHTAAQDFIEQSGYYASPAYSPHGIVFTDNYSSALYIQKDKSTLTLVSSPGCGYYYSISPDGRTLGFKYIDEKGLQAPALIDLQSCKISFLSQPVRQCGQVSFSSQGRIAFTSGNSLIIMDGDNTTTYDLGHYSNLAPISPDGNSVSFNDSNDRIWILDLTTRIEIPVSDNTKGFCYPKWSPDGKKLLYSSLDSYIFVYETASARTYTLGQGKNPSWSPDSKSVLFYRTEIIGQELNGSDIFLSSYDGLILRNITNTPETMEMDPAFGENSDHLLFHTYSGRKIVSARVISGSNKSVRIESLPLILPEVKINYFSTLKQQEMLKTLDIPYVHQKYDVPDWFNGSWACGATTAAMVLAYYKLLPKWETSCSYPYYHTNNYGRYVCEKYYFRQRDYSIGANDPNGKPGFGGFGYMWSSASPYSTIAGYYSNHGISATTKDAPADSFVTKEIKAGYPYTLCVGLTSAGHIVAAHGLGSTQGTYIFNDAWGNKNTPGYPSYDGKNAMYDWPGYNNGYQNLSTVYWGTSCHASQAAQADTIVDDLQFDKGFVLSTKAPSSMTYWRDKTQGYKGHLWYVNTRSTTAKDTAFAEWHPSLSRSGRYEVSVYIPFSTATAAPYKVYYDGGVDTVIIDQKPVTNSWVSLGRYYFKAGTSGYVRLGDATGKKGEFLVFDAVKWSYIDSINTDMGENDITAAGSYSITQNYPNPFNPVTGISYSLPKESRISLKVYNMLGQEVAVLYEGIKGKGNHNVSFNAGSLPSGTYICRLLGDNYSGIIKMMLIK